MVAFLPCRLFVVIHNGGGKYKVSAGTQGAIARGTESKKDCDKFRTTTRVVFEDQKARWVRLKMALKVKSGHKLAEVLLDTYIYQHPLE